MKGGGHMINRIVLIGRVASDYRSYKFDNGGNVISFVVAVNRPFKNKSTDERESDFFIVKAYNKTADIITTYCSKGEQIGIAGSLRSRKYKGDDNIERYINEVIIETVQLIEPKKTNQDVKNMFDDIQSAEDLFGKNNDSSIENVQNSINIIKNHQKSQQRSNVETHDEDKEYTNHSQSTNNHINNEEIVDDKNKEAVLS